MSHILPAAEWAHIAITYYQGAVYVYKNGFLVDGSETAVAETSIPDSSSDLLVGSDGSGSCFALIDELAFWDYELTEFEVYQLYNYDAVPDYDLYGGSYLLRWYRMGEGADWDASSIDNAASSYGPSPTLNNNAGGWYAWVEQTENLPVLLFSIGKRSGKDNTNDERNGEDMLSKLKNLLKMMEEKAQNKSNLNRGGDEGSATSSFGFRTPLKKFTDSTNFVPATRSTPRPKPDDGPQKKERIKRQERLNKMRQLRPLHDEESHLPDDPDVMKILNGKLGTEEETK